MFSEDTASDGHQPSSESALLPFVVSLLPLLLSPSYVHLPPHLLSRPVALRHTFLRPAADSASYLQASNDPTIQQRVSERLQRLAGSWLEDVRVDTEGVGYSASLVDDEGVRARVRIGGGSGTASTAVDGSDETSALDVMVVWEGEQAAAGPAPGASEGRGEQDTLEAGWRYYDLQLPFETSKERWYPTIEAALIAAQAPPEAATSAANPRTKAKSQRKKGRASRPVYSAAQEEGLQGEESGAPNPDDYWAGCSSSEEDGSRSGDGESESGEEEQENDYWASYDNEEDQCAGKEPLSRPRAHSTTAKGTLANPSTADTTDAVEAHSSPAEAARPSETLQTTSEVQPSSTHYAPALFDSSKRNISFLAQGEDDGGASTPSWGGIESRASLNDGHRNMSFMAEQGHLQPWLASSNGFASASGQHSPLALASGPTAADASADLGTAPEAEDVSHDEDEEEGEYIARRRYGYRNYYADAPESLYSPPTALALSFSAGADKRAVERKADNGNLLKTAVAALRQAAAAEQEEEEAARRSRSLSQSRALEQAREAGGSGRDEAVKQALRGVWELYRLAGSAQLGDGSAGGEAHSARRKDPRIERYEFLELVRSVVEGDEDE